MARTFADGSSQYLQVLSTPVTAVPITICAWFKATEATDEHVLVSINDADTDWFNLDIRGDVGGDPVRAVTRLTASQVTASTTAGYSANTWHHGCAVFIAANSRAVYLDGGSKGTNASNVTPADIANIEIGRHAAGDYMDGDIAEVAIWNIALTDAEVAVLAKGYSPLFVHPQNLVAYWSLIRDTDDDIVGGYSMTPQNAPTISAHLPIIYPVSPQIITVPAAAPGGVAPTGALQGPLVGSLGGPI